MPAHILSAAGDTVSQEASASAGPSDTERARQYAQQQWEQTQQSIHILQQQLQQQIELVQQQVAACGPEHQEVLRLVLEKQREQQAQVAQTVLRPCSCPHSTHPRSNNSAVRGAPRHVCTHVL